MLLIKYVVFTMTLIYAGYYDYKTRIILDRVHVIIIASALLANFDLLQSIVGFFLLPIPFIIAVLFKEDSVGGGDIKLTAAIGFFLGLMKGTMVLIIGQSLAILITVIFKKNRKNTIPMAPYLAIGCFISLLI